MVGFCSNNKYYTHTNFLVYLTVVHLSLHSSFYFFGPFILIDTVKKGQESGGRERGRHAAKGCGSDYNPGQPLSDLWHVVACSTH